MGDNASTGLSQEFIDEMNAGELQADPIVGTSERDRLLSALIASGDISWNDAQVIHDLTSEDDSIVKVAGMIAGELDVPRKNIVDAGRTFNINMDVRQIEEAKRSFDRTVGDVASAGAHFVRNWLGWPIDVAAEGIRDVTGIRGFGTGESFFDPEGGIAGAIIDTDEERTEKVERAQLRDDVRRFIDQLADQGVITTERAEKMKAVTDNYNARTYGDLYDELREVLLNKDYESQAEAIDDELLLNELFIRADRERGGTLPDEEEESAIADGDVEVVDVAAQAGEGETFFDILERDGIIQPGIDITPAARATFLEEDFVVDRATGQQLTRSEWELLKTNKEAAERWRSEQTVNETVQTMLDSGKFTRGAQYDTVWRYNPDTGKYEPQQRLVSPAQTWGIPQEDLAIPTAVPTGQPWEAPSYDYKVGGGYTEWMQFSTREREMRLKLMVDQGLISNAQVEAMGIMATGPLNMIAAEIWEAASGFASQFQYSQLDAIQAMGATKAAQDAANRGRGRAAPKYSVPASLREIPDYKTLATNSKQIFRGAVGRDLEDWEVVMLADELKANHVESNEQGIKAHKAWWDDSLTGGSTTVDMIERPDPNAALQYDIEEMYAGEIDRYGRVEDRANNRRLLLDSLAVGERMI